MSVTGIVLAGGRSTRFGGPKLAAELDGGSLLGRSIAAVSTVGDGVIVAGPVLPDGILPSDKPVALVRDAEPFAGPLAALANVLGRATPEADADLVLVVGGDMPGLVPAVLQAMVSRLQEDPAVDAVLLEDPGTHRQVLPLGLRVGPARSASAAAIADGERSLRALVDRLPSAEIPVASWRALDPDASTLLDVDTRSDLERIRGRES